MSQPDHAARQRYTARENQNGTTMVNQIKMLYKNWKKSDGKRIYVFSTDINPW